jgi:hypothetical protein
VKMRTSGVLASETDTRPTAKSHERLLAARTRRGHLRVGYVLAVAWVIVALALYAFQMVRLVAGRG